MQVLSKSRLGSFALVLAMLSLLAPVCLPVRAQDDDSHRYRGRKYKAPPETSKIEVTVLKGFNKKPIDGAHVIFHPQKDGKDEGFMELKTHQDGKAVIDVIPQGSQVTIQVLADGFATYAQDYTISEPNRAITVEMERPKAQVSTYVDNSDKTSQRKPGIQEPIRPPKKSSSAASGNAVKTTQGTATTSPESK